MNTNITIDGVVFSLQRAGGVSVYFRTLLEFLDSRHENAQILLEGSLLQHVEEFGVNILSIRRKARLLERYRHCCLPDDVSVFNSSYYRLPNRSNIPTVVTVYDFIYERYLRGPRQWVHTAQKNAAIRAAQAIICISESTKSDLLNFIGEIPGQTIRVIHCGVSELFHKLNIEPSGVPFVLFVGQRGGYKNFRLVLEAMAFLPDLELRCVGGGMIHPHELKDVPNSVARRIKHLGFVSDEELNIIYNRAQCLVYPSSYEGFGIPVVEAMRSGCPVVCLECKAVLEVGRDALTIVSAPDPRYMADVILKTASSERPWLVQKGMAVAQG